MRLDHTARLERLLDGHRDVQQVTGSAGGATLIRKDQLLVVNRDADEVHAKAGRWVAGRDDTVAPGISVFQLRPEAKVNVVELTESLSAGSRHKKVNAGPNHIMMAGPAWAGGPFNEPAPTDAVPTAPSADRTLATEREVVVAILDTGISEHPWFAGRKWFADCDATVFEVPDANLDYVLDSIAGHGTFIAGVVLKQASEAVLRPERVIAGDGMTDELHFLHGLAALQSKAAASGIAIDVINLSLGCYTHDDKPSPVVEQALRSLPRETVVVACAGNSASDRPYWPAALKRIIAVGSLDTTGTDRASFSNYGSWVDACTLGESIVSSFFRFDSEAAAGTNDFTGYATWSGTSFAAPRVAGAIAALAARKGYSASEAAAELLDSASHTSVPDLGVLVDVSVGSTAS